MKLRHKLTSNDNLRSRITPRSLTDCLKQETRFDLATRANIKEWPKCNMDELDQL